LADKLLAAGYTVLIDQWRAVRRAFAGRGHQVVDVKMPRLRRSRPFEMKNLEALSAKDEVKLSFPRGAIMSLRATSPYSISLRKKVRAVLFSPVFEDPEGSGKDCSRGLLVEWILADGLPVRLGLQLHKFVWIRLRRVFRSKQPRKAE